MPSYAGSNLRIDLSQLSESGIASECATSTFPAFLAPYDLHELPCYILPRASFFSDNLLRSKQWKQVANWTHHLSKTPTDKWMDCYRGYMHRHVNHNVLDFLGEWKVGLGNNNLNPIHFLRHTFLDVITIQGVPIVPDEFCKALISLGIREGLVYQFTHLNFLDITFGACSIYTGVDQLVLAITGHLPFGPQTILFTFGAGTAEVIGGIVSHNPLLIAGGGMKITAGCVSLWKHYHIPYHSPVLLPDTFWQPILTGAAQGAAVGVIFCSIRLALQWSTTNPMDKTMIALESVGLGALLGGLSVISPFLSIPMGLTYAAAKFSVSLADSDSDFWSNLPPSMHSIIDEHFSFTNNFQDFYPDLQFHSPPDLSLFCRDDLAAPIDESLYSQTENIHKHSDSSSSLHSHIDYNLQDSDPFVF